VVYVNSFPDPTRDKDALSHERQSILGRSLRVASASCSDLPPRSEETEAGHPFTSLSRNTQSTSQAGVRSVKRLANRGCIV